VFGSAPALPQAWSVVPWHGCPEAPRTLFGGTPLTRSKLIDISITAGTVAAGELAEENAKQGEQRRRGKHGRGTGLEVDFANLRRGLRSWGGSDKGKNGRRRELRLSQHGSRTTVKSEIGKIYLGQDQYQRKQKELDT